MNREHIKLVRDVLTRTVNRQHVDPQEYGLALLACDEALATQPAPTETGPNRDWNLKVRISHATTFNGREMGSSSGSWTLAQLHDLLKAEHAPQGAPRLCSDTRRNPSGFCESCGLAH